MPSDKTHSLNEVFSIDANLTGKETMFEKEHIFLFILLIVYPGFDIENMIIPRVGVKKLCQIDITIIINETRPTPFRCAINGNSLVDYLNYFPVFYIQVFRGLNHCLHHFKTMFCFL